MEFQELNAWKGQDLGQQTDRCGWMQLDQSLQARFLFDAVLELNKQESQFDEENMEKTSMKEGDVRVTHPSFSCEYAYYYFSMNHKVDTYSPRKKNKGDVKVIESDPKNLNQIMLDGIWETNKHTSDENKKQFLLEEEHVEIVESVPGKPDQPPAPPLLGSQSHLDCFTVVTDAEMTLVQENQSLPKEKNVGIRASNLWSRKQKDGNRLQTGCMEKNLNPKKVKENQVEITKQRRILKENSSTEIIFEETNVRCEKKSGVLGEKNRDCILQVLPPEIGAYGFSSTVTGRVPFQSLSQNSRVNNRLAIRSSLKNTNKSIDNHQGLQSELIFPLMFL